jgi:hypothetical protein
MKKMPYMIKNAPITQVIWIRDRRPIELEKRAAFGKIYVTIINSFDTLERNAKQMKESRLWMRVTETVSCPANFDVVSELLGEEVGAKSILV